MVMLLVMRRRHRRRTESRRVDPHLRVYGYENLLVCDDAAMPANPGVNPALTITALAEYAMAQIPKGVRCGTE
jgi:cholesterol oxidase